MTIRWGILGPGRIARTFAAALREAEGAELVAVGSRDAGRAAAFAREHGAAHAHGSYEALAADPGVDAVYVATPHPSHARDAILCLEAGKHVLCEKPLAVNAAQGGRMAAAARAQGRVLMEAMWTRFLPAMDHVRGLLAMGAIGDVRLLQADFGFRTDAGPDDRLLAPELAGGALLDLGVYPLHLAHMVCGEPVAIHAAAQRGPTGVDEAAAVVLQHPVGRLSLLSCALRVETPGEARILGTRGRITLPRPWWAASRVVVHGADGGVEERVFPVRGAGYAHEAEAFMEAIRSGDHECALLPPDASLAVLRTMDAIRADWGLRYPCEGDAGA